MYFSRASEPTRSYVGQKEHRSGRECPSRKSSFHRRPSKASSTRSTRHARQSLTRANVLEESRGGAKRDLEESRLLERARARRDSLSASGTRLVDRAVALQLQRFRDSCDALPQRAAERIAGNHVGDDRPQR